MSSSGMRRERLEEPHGPHIRRCLVSRPQDGRHSGLLMVLHGAGATAAWMFQEVALEDWAACHGWVLAFPEATRAQMDKPPHVLENTPCWEDGSNRRMPRPAPGADDLQWLGGWINRWGGKDGKPVVLAGFSNGASMALRLAASNQVPLSGVLAIGGYLRAEIPATVPLVPTVFLHGRLDPLVPPQGGWVKTPWQAEGYPIPPMAEAVGSWSRAMGATRSVTSVEPGLEQTRFLDEDGKEWVRWYMVEKLGHHWPGGKGQWENQSMGPRLDDGPVLVADVLDKFYHGFN